MAGLEVAGLVLGTLPLAVKAVQGYRETFYSIKNVKRDLDYIERDLQTEKLRLQNTCEGLLVGIVPPRKIHSMIEDPCLFVCLFYLTLGVSRQASFLRASRRA
ncbi:hypothetical protein F5B21DRAFT_473944 [Xylaria acuta]|nr:hypothetical protein F5B21DRAFT_473944 [Xylaria acuta]